MAERFKPIAAIAALFLPGVAHGQEAHDASLGALPRDLTPWGMFLSADIVVKLVIVGLLFASIVTWTVWLVKTLELARSRRALAQALAATDAARSLADVRANSGMARTLGADFVAAAAAELALSEGADDKAGLKERVASRLDRLELRAARQLSIGTGILGTIGATAPFVGLFGTVWGIMNSFVGITREQTTNLAVVAPGIAEALLATAIGLVAAIPAVVIYNHFARRTAACRLLMGDLGAAVQRLVSRDLDRGVAPSRPAG